MKILISDDIKKHSRIPEDVDNRLQNCKNLDVNYAKRYEIDATIMTVGCIKIEADKKNLIMDENLYGPLWNVQAILHKPYSSFIYDLCESIRLVKKKLNIEVLFSLDMHPIYIEFYPNFDLEIFYNIENTSITDILSMLKIGLQA